MIIDNELIEKIVAEIKASEDEIVEKVKDDDYYCFYNLRLVIEGVDYCSIEIKIKELRRVDRIYKACFSEPTQKITEISFDYYVDKLYINDGEVDEDIVDEINNKLCGYIERNDLIER